MCAFVSHLWASSWHNWDPKNITLTLNSLLAHIRTSLTHTHSQDKLEPENTPDLFGAEQTWPTAEEEREAEGMFVL